MPKTDNQKKTDSPPLNRLYIGLVLAILVIETAVMLAFNFFLEAWHLSPLVEGLADSLVLVIFLIPPLHFLFYRPLSLEITRYKQALETIRGLKIGYGVIVRTAMDSFWITDIQGRILEVNDAYCSLIGYSREELLTMSVLDLRAEEKPEDTKRHIQRIIESGSDRFESKHRRKDGRIVDLEVSVNYLDAAGGRLFAFLRDITERKKTQFLLEKLAAVVRQTADIVVITDTDGKIEYVNPAFEAQTGYKAEEVIGKTPRVLKSGRQDKSFYERLWQTILAGEVFSDTFVNKKKDGQLYYSEKTITPIKDKQGNIVNFVSTDKDITARKKMEDELNRVNKELRGIDRMKNEFINMASHELRTPIAIVKEGVTQLAEGLPDEIGLKQKRLAEISLRNISRLVRVVDNIFEVSEIEFEKPAPKKELVDIAELAKAALAEFMPLAKGKGLEIKENLPQQKVMISIDKIAVSRVWSNLISNAVKFTERGHIKIKISQDEETVECSVSDTGIGIAPENLPKVFEKFQQFNRSFGPGERGTGLGLAIAKGIVELHKGRIWTESKLGEGSKFSFVLPK